jgi:hypothetical protein
MKILCLLIALLFTACGGTESGGGDAYSSFSQAPFGA